MTLQQLKDAIIKDEAQFIEDLFHDETLLQEEYTERVNEMMDEVNSCQSPDELVYYYMEQGCSEKDANRQLYYYLIKD
jgi:hypothetical protein